MSDVVTVIIKRAVKSGFEKNYEDWLNRLSEAAKIFEGYLGSEFHRPPSGSNIYTSVIRFKTLSALEEFEDSDLRVKFLKEAEPFVDGDAIWEKMTGLEFWFDPPEGTQVPQPSQLRMTLLLIVVVFSLVYVIGGIVGSMLGDWPYPIRLLITITIEIFLMTYLIMPRLTKLLARWIYPSQITKM